MSVKPLDYLRAVRDDQELSPSEQIVALYIMSHAGKDGTGSHPGNALLAKETGLSEKTVKLAIARLRELGWIVQTYNGRGGNQAKASEYSLAIPKGHEVTLIPQPKGTKGTSKEHLGSPKVTLTDSQSNVSTLTDAPINAPRNALRERSHPRVDSRKSTSPRASLASTEVPGSQVVRDYRTNLESRFSQFIEEPMYLPGDVVDKLYEAHSDAEDVPVDLIVYGSLTAKQYSLMIVHGKSNIDAGVKSLPSLICWNLRNKDVVQVEARGWTNSSADSKRTDDSGYDPRVCGYDVIDESTGMIYY